MVLWKESKVKTITTMLLVLLMALALTACPPPPTADVTPAPSPDPSPADPPSPPRLSVGQSYSTAGVQVTFDRVYYVKSRSGLQDVPNIIAIDVTLKNTSAQDKSYMSLSTWGALVDSNGNQESEIAFPWAANTHEFNGTSIVAGATIQDTRIFDVYTGTPASFTFKGKPPFGGAEKFELAFALADVQAQ